MFVLSVLKANDWEPEFEQTIDNLETPRPGDYLTIARSDGPEAYRVVRVIYGAKGDGDRLGPDEEYPIVVAVRPVRHPWQTENHRRLVDAHVAQGGEVEDFYPQ